MPEVQNIGAADYAQYQTQYPEQYSVPQDLEAQDYYDPAIEEKKEASKSHLGATIAAMTVAAFITGVITHHFSTKSAKNALKEAEGELDALRNSEAVKNYDGLVKNYDELKKATDKVHEIVGDKPKFKIGKSYWPNRWFKDWFKASKVRNVLKPFYNKTEAAAKEGTEAAAKEGTEAVAEEAVSVAK